MKVTYKISEKDFISANRLGARLSLNFLGITILLSLGVIGCLLLVNIIPMNIQIMLSIANGLLFGIVFLIFFNVILNPIIFKLYYKKYPLMKNSQFYIDIDDESVLFEAEESKTKLIWKNIVKWRENKKFILLYISPRQFFIVPKILSEQSFDIGLLRKKLLNNIGNPK